MDYSNTFLNKLQVQQHQTKYARITVLDTNDKPLESIDGVITGGGPISVDGSSAVRRTCSLNMNVEKDSQITDAYWALTNKFKVEIGLLNNIDFNHPKIIWLNQGVYIISSFTKSINLKTINISISGRDKMVKLNGEMGGLFSVSTTLDTIETINKDGSVSYDKIPIYYIIRNMVHELGGEPWHNIIINDLDEYGYELWEYRGVKRGGEEMPMYMFYEVDGDQRILRNMTIDENKQVWKDGYSIELKDISDNDLYHTSLELETGSTFKLSNNNNSKDYYIKEIEYGETAGYHRTALVYPGDLVMSPGQRITDALDKIKNVLGDFEYFYDIEGHFIFQKKKTYINSLFSPINGDTIDAFVDVSPYAYELNDDRLQISISNSYSIDKVKNDFSIWGNRRSENGGDKLPILARYAICKKPEKYKSFPFYKKAWLTYIKATEYKKDEKKPEKALIDLYVIENGSYRKALEKDFESILYWIELSITPFENEENTLYNESEGVYSEFNKELYLKTNNIFVEVAEQVTTVSDEYYYCKEQSKEYTIEDYDWRELIYIMARDYYQHNQNPNYLIELMANNDWCIENRATGYEIFYADFQAFWRRLYNPEGNDEYFLEGDYKYWNKNVLFTPEKLDFWIDFLDTGGEIDKYSIANIGHRQKVDNASNNGVTSIFNRNTPEVEFVVQPYENVNKDGPNQIFYIQDNMKQIFNISAQGKASNARANELIWNHSCITEGINITCIPLYTLEPNTRIKYKNDDYIVNKITIPITYNGTMSISATKIINNL